MDFAHIRGNSDSASGLDKLLSGDTRVSRNWVRNNPVWVYENSTGAIVCFEKFNLDSYTTPDSNEKEKENSDTVERSKPSSDCTDPSKARDTVDHDISLGKLYTLCMN